MLIVLTVREILDRGLWKDVCDLRRVNEYAVKEGLIDTADVFRFTETEAVSLGLIPEPPA